MAALLGVGLAMAALGRAATSRRSQPKTGRSAWPRACRNMSAAMAARPKAASAASGKAGWDNCSPWDPPSRSADMPPSMPPAAAVTG